MSVFEREREVSDHIPFPSAGLSCHKRVSERESGRKCVCVRERVKERTCAWGVHSSEFKVQGPGLWVQSLKFRVASQVDPIYFQGRARTTRCQKSFFGSQELDFPGSQELEFLEVRN